MVLVLLLFLFGNISELQSCNIDVCLTWSATKEKISFKCKVNSLLFTVKFFNQLHEEHAYCLSPIPLVSCYSLLDKDKSIITQDALRNITILTLEKRIDDTINGAWTCFHGTEVDKAVVNVTVLRGAVADEQSDFWINCVLLMVLLVLFSDDLCWKKNTTWTFVGFLIAFFVCFTVRCMQECLNLHCTAIIQRTNMIMLVCSNLCINEVCSSVLKRVIVYLLIVAVITLPLVGYGEVDCSGQYAFIAFGLVMGFVLIYLFVTEKGIKCCQLNSNDARSNNPNQATNIDVELQFNPLIDIQPQQDRLLDDGTNQEGQFQDNGNETDPCQTHD